MYNWHTVCSVGSKLTQYIFLGVRGGGSEPADVLQLLLISSQKQPPGNAQIWQLLTDGVTLKSSLPKYFHLAQLSYIGKISEDRGFRSFPTVQILPNNEKHKSETSPIIWDGRGRIGKIGRVSCFPTCPRFLRLSENHSRQIKTLKLVLWESFAIVLARYQSPKLQVWILVALHFPPKSLPGESVTSV